METKLPVFKTIQEVLLHLWQQKFIYLRNAAFLQFFISTIGFGILSVLFKVILSLSGQENLTFSNFKVIFTSPLSIMAMLGYLFAVALLIFIEFSILTFMIYGTFTHKHFSWHTSIKNAFGELRHFFGPQLLLFLLYFITLIPLTNFIVISTLTEKLYIPNFITEEITKTTIGWITYIGMMIFLMYFHLRLAFTLPLQILTEDSFSKNLKHSWQVTRQKTMRITAIFFFMELLLLIISFLVGIVLTILATLLSNITTNSGIIISILTIIKISGFFMTLSIKLAFLIALIDIVKDSSYVSQSLKDHRTQTPFKNVITTTLALLGLIIHYSTEAYAQYHAQTSPQQLIIAHRGFVEYGVENSLEALEAAAKAGADYVEMDVLLTKDHHFIVMHDYNLKRLAKLNKRVENMTYDEIVGLPIYQGHFVSHIPSFETFVAKAKELDIKLLIELKPHGKEPENYIDLFIAKLRELNIDTEAKVMSLNLALMEKIEEKYPYIDTGYVIPIQFGGFGNPKVDFYVIEDFSYQELAVLNAKEDGHDVYVWTINDSQQLDHYLKSSVSGIITDIPDIARQQARELSEHQTPLDQLLQTIGFQ